MDSQPENSANNENENKIVIADQNNKTIRDEIYNLEYGHYGDDGKRDYKLFFTHAKEITKLFKTLELLPEDRKVLWRTFKHLCDNVRKKQDKEWESKRGESEKIAAEIMEQIEKAVELGSNANTQSEFDKANNILIKCLNKLKKISDFLLRNERKKCWNAWKKAKDDHETRREQIGQTAFNKLSEEANNILGIATDDNPHDAIKMIREVRTEIKNSILTRKQYKDVHEILQKAGDVAIGRIKDGSFATSRGRIRSLLEDDSKRLKDKLPKIKFMLGKKEEELDKLENEIDYLDELIENYEGNDNAYISKIENYINEKEDKIEEVFKDVKDLKAKIKEIEEN